MFQSTQFKTSDGKRKNKGRRKPLKVKQSNQRRTQLLIKLTVK